MKIATFRSRLRRFVDGRATMKREILMKFGAAAQRIILTERMIRMPRRGKQWRDATTIPPLLGIRSGDLARGLRYEMRGDTLYFVNDVVYARIQEKGGTISHPGSSGKLQVFLPKTGGLVFTMKTKPHTIKLPKRPAVALGLADAERRSLKPIAFDVTRRTFKRVVGL